MPKRGDIKSVLIIGAGQLLLGKLVSLIIRAHKLVRHYEKKATV